ncbi:hypothetical protein C8R43DRAFT_699908 [Mycena crocata]|nr:hypothetical protein C8R43DRAFT_699908 [Mycena crocata]
MDPNTVVHQHSSAGGHLFRSRHQRCFSAMSRRALTLLLASHLSHRGRGEMNHPYSGAAGYIYANEHPSPPPAPQSKNPYSKLPSFVPSPSSITSNPILVPRKTPHSSPRTSHDTSWSTEGTYTRTQRPKYDDVTDPPARPRGNSLSRPLIPLRAPISHPYQQRHNTSWIDYSGENPTVDANGNAMLIVPPARSTSRLPLPLEAAPSTSPKMTPYERDGDPLSLRRSAFMPHEPGPFDAERAMRASWRNNIQRRIRRAVRRLRRLMCVSSIHL